VSESLYIPHRQKETLDALDSGDVIDVCASQRLAIDEIVSFGLKKGFLKQGLRLFPDPRKNWEVPIEVLLLPQILQRLNNEHSLLLAPYMLNSAELMTELGYNAQVLDEGFNQRNTHARKAPFNGETLKHLLLSADSEELIQWFNTGLLPLWREQAGKARTHRYILDGTKIEVPAHRVKGYQGAGTVRNEDDTTSHGYKVVWLQEILEIPAEPGCPSRFHRGMIVGLRIGPIEEHDLSLGRWLVSEFQFEEGDTLIFDRGFIDGAWVTELKEKRKIDAYFTLRRNMKLSKEVLLRAYAERNDQWTTHPTRKNQWVQRVLPWDLTGWEDCPVLKSGALVKWKNKDGSFDEVLFVSTKDDESPEKILSIYDERSQIEESHRHMKSFQGIDVLLSKKWVHVVFRILMGVIAFNLINLFLVEQERSKKKRRSVFTQNFPPETCNFMQSKGDPLLGPGVRSPEPVGSARSLLGV
jgi:hypothetical protein